MLETLFLCFDIFICVCHEVLKLLDPLWTLNFDINDKNEKHETMKINNLKIAINHQKWELLDFSVSILETS